MNSKPQRSFVSEIKKDEQQKLRSVKIVAFAMAVVLVFILGATALINLSRGKNVTEISEDSLDDIPLYNGSPYCVLNDNIPLFDEVNVSRYEPYENYADLDYWGRCGCAFAVLCIETMPTEEREPIGQVKPSGWNQEKYPGVVDSEPPYLYNRCHLIGFQLAGENANDKNLITGTRYFNVEGMLPFENKVKEYIVRTGNHVLYRVTPIYDKNNLVANGVIMEALSVEDSGEGICFNVFVYNIQPGVDIDYSDGSSNLSK